MRNELYRHKKSDKIKWVFTGIAFVLVFVLLTGMCLQLFGTGKQKPSEWFKKTECVHVDEDKDGKCDKCKKAMPMDETFDGNGGAIVNGNTVNNGIKLMSTRIAAADYAANGVKSSAENAYVIEAIIKPDNLDSKQLGWELSFVNPESVWANGKVVTDYVTVTPKSDGTTAATLTCLQPFGEQIQLKVFSLVDEEIYSTCTLDFLSRISEMRMDIGETVVRALPSETSFTYTYTTPKMSTIALRANVNGSLGGYTVGTYTGGSSTLYIPQMYSVKLEQTPEYASALAATSVYINDLTPQSVSVPTSGATSKVSGGGWFPYSMLNNTSLYVEGATLAERHNAMIEALRALGNKPFFKMTFTYVRSAALVEMGFEQYYSYDLYIYADLNSLSMVVESVSLSDTNILFA